jgi:GDPmannose 4,6-dehydratase
MLLPTPQCFRPAEVELLLGDASKAGRVLGWKPTHTFDQIIQEMADADLKRFSEERMR